MNPIDAVATRLRPHYSRFLASGEALLTGHSHQAWPDVSRDAQLECWDDAARLADRKWGHIFGAVLPTWQRHVARRIGSARPADLALAPNTHDLLVRLLSCLPPKPSIVTTSAEFHSVRRQVARLAEDGARVRIVEPDEDAVISAARGADLTIVSAVLFTTARILDVRRIAANIEGVLVVDAYHAFNCTEFANGAPGEASVDGSNGTRAFPADALGPRCFVLGGGYKYAQGGEGTAWMLLPADASDFRPRDTGWFASFESLETSAPGVGYGAGGARFLGSTFDPSGLYRANASFALMDSLGLDPRALRAQSVLQTARIVEAADRLGLRLASPREPERRAAFVSLEVDDAGELVSRLAARGVRADHRGRFLRLGPAPYTTTEEIDRAMSALARSIDP